MLHPTRVMINQFEAIPPGRAKNEHNIKPVIIFVRNDGWSLGAPEEYEVEAHAMWSDSWTHFTRHPFTYIQSIDNYTMLGAIG